MGYAGPKSQVRSVGCRTFGTSQAALAQRPRRQNEKAIRALVRLPFVSSARLAPALLALLPLFTAAPAAHAASADLLGGIPIVNEHAINDVACGQAAATMLLDYELGQAGATPARVSIGTVARYVKFSYRGGVPTGTSPTSLARGVVAASDALGVPLSASWQRTAPDNWEATLRQQLDAGQPVIVYLTDGGMLWHNAWRYGHYVVVSGLTADGQVLYHDPFDGREHAIAATTFGRVWGYGTRRAWTYLHVTPAA